MPASAGAGRGAPGRRRPFPPPGASGDRPRYQLIADDVQRFFAPGTPEEQLPSVESIVWRYGVEHVTALFVRRALVTRTRLASGDLGGPPPARRGAVWRGVARDLAQRAARGRLTGRLPDSVRLAAEYGVRAATIDAAVAALIEQGVLRSVGHRGVYVVPRHTV
ncbi:hypothetical protein [Streptomyces sp. NPDC050504]|uniref:hypothetical protein n=1 Tax=Streptomyces sp. NPDC050504 TaxID=3365618 RepID=UPI0037BCB60C